LPQVDKSARSRTAQPCPATPAALVQPVTQIPSREAKRFKWAP
jgi:hypothetical protein